MTLQPEAMLLWLTLTLLWCPICWVHHKSSWGSPPPILLEAPLTPPSVQGSLGQLVSQIDCSQACPLVWRGCVLL